MESADQTQHQVHRMKRGRPPKTIEVVPADKGDAARINAAQAYAERIWNGQSPDLPRVERISRVRAGLERQGMSMDDIEL